MNAPFLRASLAAVIAVSLAGCAPSDGLRIGVKGFTEQEIIGEMLRALLIDGGTDVDRLVPCGDTYACHRSLATGSVDVLIEYSGTLQQFAGTAAASRQGGAASMDATAAALGMAWLGKLGFDNDYVVVITEERAVRDSVRSIADLAKRSKDGTAPALRVAVPAEFLRRPGDGLEALTQRYGLRLEGEPFAIASPAERLNALLSGRVDFAVVYATDGALSGLPVRGLEDDDGFFLRYEAGIVARTGDADTAQRLAGPIAALRPLLNNEAMRHLNYRADVEHADVSVVTRELLLDRELLNPDTPLGPRPAELTVAVARQDALAPLEDGAVRAISRAYPDRRLRRLVVDSPASALSDGRADLAVVGSERFFVRSRGEVMARDERLEAAAVVGSRFVHVVRRADDAAGGLSGRLGGPPEKSGSRIVVDALAGTEGVSQSDAPEALLAAVAQGSLDAAILLLPLGAPALSHALQEGGLALVETPGPTTDASAAAFPYLRAARIPAGTYADQAEPVSTFATQVLVAGAGPNQASGVSSGPAAAMAGEARPLTPQEVERLADATGIAEAPDPRLPTAWNRIATPHANHDGWLSGTTTLLNVFAVLFLIALGLVIRSDKSFLTPPSS